MEEEGEASASVSYIANMNTSLWRELSWKSAMGGGRAGRSSRAIWGREEEIAVLPGGGGGPYDKWEKTYGAAS